MSKITSPVAAGKLSVGSITTLDLDATQDFLGEILEELNETVDKAERGDESQISFKGELEKMSGKYEEFLHLVGTLKTTYYTHDIMSNDVMTDSLEQEVKCLVLTA